MWFKVCLFSDLNYEKLVKFSIEGLDILFAKSFDDKIWAFDNTCSHADKPLEKGKWNPAAAEITCPFHRSTFSLAEQGTPKNPPAVSPLSLYEVEIREEGGTSFVYVNI